jgi:hypothetical protein
VARQSEAAAEVPPEPADTPSLVADRYIIGPGSGQTLLLCNRQEQASQRLASDIARCLDEAPVWGWQAQVKAGTNPEIPGLSLEDAIRDRLFTRVLLFGAAAGTSPGESEVIGSARIIQAPSLAELGESPQQKRSLWAQLVAHGWCKKFTGILPGPPA